MNNSEKDNNFIQMEHDVLKFWEEQKCFDRLKEKNSGGPVFRFLDGPITANNRMGIHHAWGRTLKDMYIRYKAMHGHTCHYRNGFDTQGLWVEVEVEKELGFKDKRDIEAYGMDNFTRRCVERIEKFSKTIGEQSKRLGQWMDWENSYYTHTDENITGIWAFLKKCHDNGWIAESHRPMPWCPRCGTSLSEHEMSGSYKEIEHQAVFFKLPLVEMQAKMLVWTTTPWTLSSNVALAVNPDIDYVEVKVKSDEKPLILAKDALGVLGEDKLEVLRVMKGSTLVGLHFETCFHEFSRQKDVEHKVVPWDIVDPKEGTGIVHIAPGCGAEDFELGQTENLASIMPVDDMGVFVEGFGFLTGQKTQDVAPIVLEELEKQNKLYKGHNYKHSYPVCWRCKSEVIFRLVRAWYIKTEEIRPRLIKAANSVKWEPEYIGKRMQDWLSNMGDWNISRKRFYGLPLPFYLCEHCDTLTVVGSKEELRELAGEAVDQLPELHRPWVDEIKIQCPCCSHKVSRVPEVGDVWLDAGIVPYSTLGYFKDKEKWKQYFPAEWVSEMREQVRLWFYSLLFMSVTLEDRAPYEKVLAHNSVVSEDGTKFSKTGFMISFDEASEKMGVDPIRYLFAGANLTSDVRFGFSLGDEARRKLLSFWNVAVFFQTYAAIDMPQITKEIPNEARLTVTDRWLIARTNQFIQDANQTMDRYQSFALVKEFENYIDEVSNWYIRVNRRRFWKSEEVDEKQNAYWCLYHAIKATVQIMAPIMPFMTEHIWQNLIRPIEKEAEISVHLSVYPKADIAVADADILEKTHEARKAIALALRLRNENQVKLRQPLQKLFIKVNERLKEGFMLNLSIIKEELNVKEVVFIEDHAVLEEAYLVVNFKKAGSVLKQNVQAVKSLLEAVDESTMSKLVEAHTKEQEIQLTGWDEPLMHDLFVRQTKPKSCYVVGVEGGLTVALDITLTETLLLEGACREIVRQIQVLRKQADFKVEQRIRIALQTNSAFVQKVLDTYQSHIQNEVLAVEVLASIDNPQAQTEIELSEGSVSVFVAP